MMNIHQSEKPVVSTVGLQTSTETGRKTKSLHKNNLPDYISEQFAEAGRQGLPISCEFTSYARNGQKQWKQTCVQPVMDKAGKVICFSVIETDISAQRQCE